MTDPTRGKSRFLLGGLILVIAVLSLVSYRFVFSSPAYDPAKIAEAETKMWQAYYTGDHLQLGLHLIGALRNQYGLSFLAAKEIAETLAQSAMVFLSAQGDYEPKVLPDLIQAYTRIKNETGASFDPEQVARAELAWWIARRTPGQDSPHQVGEKIAKQYALLYGKDHPSFHQAGLLRASAARVRDIGGSSADWAKVETLLVESYTALAEAI